MNIESDIIYKFLPSDRLSYLQDELLRITQPGDLNDPFECLPFPASEEETIQILKGLLNIKLKEVELLKIPKSQKKERKILIERTYKSNMTNVRKNVKGNLREIYFQEQVDRINRVLGILSLTRRWNSTLMWSHYTNAHKGFCVGFDTNDDFFKQYKGKLTGEIMFMPVNYANERIKVPIAKDEKIDPFVMLTKSKDWQYEEEERLLISLSKANKKIPNKPFDIYLYKVPHYIIKEIIAGANISKEDLENIKMFCLENKIALYQSKISEYKFDMTRIPV